MLVFLLVRPDAIDQIFAESIESRVGAQYGDTGGLYHGMFKRVFLEKKFYSRKRLLRESVYFRKRIPNPVLAAVIGQNIFILVQIIV